jgi:tellurite resistance protein TehA-like permease
MEQATNDQMASHIQQIADRTKSIDSRLFVGLCALTLSCIVTIGPYIKPTTEWARQDIMRDLAVCWAVIVLAMIIIGLVMLHGINRRLNGVLSAVETSARADTERMDILRRREQTK